ncbi:hypothetical protein F4604DRAFT_1259910 [Suillus subluteus]|nr:hypothetical protein F4604DRAFT_1259910 [Suillus subluteus]
MNSHYTPSQAAQIALPLAPRGVNNVFIVLVTSVLYDFVTNLGDELDYLLGSRMTLAKGLFLGCRYTTFAICAIHARMVLSPSVEGCPGFTESNILLLGIVLLCAECKGYTLSNNITDVGIHLGIFVLRTYALWNCDRRVRIALLILYLALFCATIILVLGCGLQLKNTKFTTGCYS